jgi:uncharacterized protein
MPSRPPLAESLNLRPHPEGGWFRETWRSAISFSPAGYEGPRCAATAIYFVLYPGEQSRWHVVRSDELWFWHDGGTLELRLGGMADGPEHEHTADQVAPVAGGAPSEAASATRHPSPAGVVLLGPDVLAGQQPQALVPGGTWQSAVPATDQAVLVSCVVAPGFDFADFRLG